MITQCEIRKLYAQNKEPGISEAIDLAKTFERRRCGHHPEEYPEPMSTHDCLESIVDPKGSGQNKHRYVVASQDQDVRRMLRGVRAVPLIYIKRSVMILEPMADENAQARAREEKSKFRAEIKKALGKRKREEGDHDTDDEDEQSNQRQISTPAKEKKKTKAKGPKGPNPLAVKKPKKKSQDAPTSDTKESKPETGSEAPAKRKRRRRNKAKGETADGEGNAPPTASGSTED